MSAWRDEPCDKGFMFEFSSDCFLASGANQDMVTVSSTFLPHPSIRSQKRALRVRLIAQFSVHCASTFNMHHRYLKSSGNQLRTWKHAGQ